jgi:hypothetical protein
MAHLALDRQARRMSARTQRSSPRAAANAPVRSSCASLSEELEGILNPAATGAEGAGIGRNCNAPRDYVQSSTDWRRTACPSGGIQQLGWFLAARHLHAAFFPPSSPRLGVVGTAYDSATNYGLLRTNHDEHRRAFTLCALGPKAIDAICLL